MKSEKFVTDISLVICTRNRARQLKDCLQYVARLKPSRSWELVVVDNGSSDETDAILAEYTSNVPFSTKLLQESVPGLSRARNTGCKAAHGEIIAFIDDDCYVAPDYIDKVWEAFSDAKVGFAGGRVDLFDPADYPITITTSDRRELMKPRNFIPAGMLHGANMMFRRTALEGFGGFDPDMGAGARFFSCEDTDAQARASFAGWWGLYTPAAVVAHHHRRTAKDVPALRRGYALGRGAYMAKFLLVSEARPTYLRHWYWSFRSALRGSRQARREFIQEIQGASAYLVHRIRKRITE
jgi:glycosyltransferase involved in cell wall biosynthesis